MHLTGAISSDALMAGIKTRNGGVPCYKASLMIEPNRKPERLMNRMKWGIYALCIGILAGVLATSAMACPLWMGMLDNSMPCSDQSTPQCPFTVCQASSSYLTGTQVNSIMPLPDEVPAVIVVPTIIVVAVGSPEPDERNDGPPPGALPPLFLQTHSLLI